MAKRILRMNSYSCIVRNSFNTRTKNFRFVSTTHVKCGSEALSSITIDNSEVKKFGKGENVWWNKYGPYKALHSLNEIRVPFIRDSLLVSDKNIDISKQKVLDVGCGGGILCEALAKLGCQVTGIDASENLISVAKDHSIANKELNNKPNYYHTTSDDFLKTHSNFFDVVVSSEVIEHVNNQKLFVKSCIDLCKPGGRIVITTLNRSLATLILYLWITEELDIIPKGTHEYKKLLKYQELKSWFEEYNCDVESTPGLFYHIFTNRWELRESKKVWFAMRAMKRG